MKLSCCCGFLSPRACAGTAQPIVRLLGDAAFPTCDRCRLAVRNPNLDLPQQTHNLFRSMLLALCHLPLLFVQSLSLELVQKRPGTPDSQDTYAAVPRRCARRIVCQSLPIPSREKNSRSPKVPCLYISYCSRDIFHNVCVQDDLQILLFPPLRKGF